MLILLPEKKTQMGQKTSKKRGTLSKARGLFFILCFLHVAKASCLHVDVSAQAAILIDAETGAVLFEKHAHIPLYPASITKIITALYALEKKGENLDESVVASPDAIATVQPHVRRSDDGKHPPYRLEFGGTHVGIKAGECLPLRSLLYGLMLESGNDAANVIAQHISGSIPQFIEELNAFVKLQGCKNTRLLTPHGLPCVQHTTTAYDMALLTRRALTHPFFCEVVKTTQYTRPQTNKQAESHWQQRNALVKPGKFYYSKAIGVKTGYTTVAGYTLVAAAQDENRKLITVLLGYEHPYERYKDAIALFEAAFQEKPVCRTLFSKGFDHFSCSMPGALTPLDAELSSDLVLTYYPSEEPVFSTKLEWFPSSFPIQKGQHVGEICVINQDHQVLMRQPLFAMHPVDSTWSHRMTLIFRSLQAVLSRNLAFLLGTIGTLLIAVTFWCSSKKKAGV